MKKMLKKVSENEKKITVIVSKMRVLGQKKTTGGGAKRPPPACLGLRIQFVNHYLFFSEREIQVKNVFVFLIHIFYRACEGKF